MFSTLLNAIKMGYFVTFLLGTLLLIGSLRSFYSSVLFIKMGNRAVATVDEVVQERGQKGGYIYRPIFRFTTDSGEVIYHSYPVASKPPDWVIGEKATIVYRPDDLENPMVLTYFGAFKWAIILLIIAFGLLVIGGGYYLFTLYSKPFLL